MSAHGGVQLGARELKFEQSINCVAMTFREHKRLLDAIVIKYCLAFSPLRFRSIYKGPTALPLDFSSPSSTSTSYLKHHRF